MATDRGQEDDIWNDNEVYRDEYRPASASSDSESDLDLLDLSGPLAPSLPFENPLYGAPFVSLQAVFDWC